MPTHSMPLTWRRLGPLAAAHVHLGVVDPERLDLDHHVAGFRLRLRDVLVDKAVQPTDFSRTMARTITWTPITLRTHVRSDLTARAPLDGKGRTPGCGINGKEIRG